MGIKDDAITYRQLRVFREVCAKGTVSRAGDDNGMKQSNVSASIADLEANLGLQLFNRIKNKMVLTAAGKDILNYIMGFDRIMYDVKKLQTTEQHPARNRETLDKRRIGCRLCVRLFVRLLFAISTNKRRCGLQFGTAKKS